MAIASSLEPWAGVYVLRAPDNTGRMDTSLSAVALVCTLSPSPAESSTELLASQLLEELGKHGVSGTSIRVVDHDVKPGVKKDMGEGDAWPGIRQQILDADILVFCSPTWVGHMSSVAQ